jgi:hypothetical protein
MISFTRLTISQALWSHTDETPAVSPEPGYSFVPNLVGDEYVDEISTNRLPACVPRLTKDIMSAVRDDMPTTIRASHATIPPPDLGLPSAGKLKAGEWMAVMEFDLPVTLVKILQTEPGLDSATVELIRATLFLAIALRYALSTVTSSTHQAKYLDYMQKYLRIIRQLYPKQHLRPNHHAALHFAEFLKRFGPARNFWMLPFERIIGKLQNSPSNYKPGPHFVL